MSAIDKDPEKDGELEGQELEEETQSDLEEVSEGYAEALLAEEWDEDEEGPQPELDPMAETLEASLSSKRAVGSGSGKGKAPGDEVIVGGRGESRKLRQDLPNQPQIPWESLAATVGWVGWALLAVGGADIFLTWYPFRFGDPQWEFATVSATFNGYPVVIFGLLLVLLGAAGVPRRWWAYLGVLIAGLLLAIALYGIVIFWSTSPLALDSVQGIALTGLKKAMSKAAAQSLVYPVILGLLARRLWRTARPSRVEDE